MLASLILPFVCVTVLLVYLKYKHTYWRRRGIPHDEPVFPKGNLQGYRTEKHICRLTQETYDKFKGSGLYAGFYYLFSPTVIALDLDFVKNVLIKDFNNFPDRGAFFNEIDDPLTGNLFHMDGPKWRTLRQRLSPVFTSGKIKSMFPMIQSVADELIAVLGDKQRQCSADGSIEVTDFFARYTADVIGSCAFGLECHSLSNPDAEFVKIGRKVVVSRRHNGLIGTFIESAPQLARKLRFRRLPQECHDFYMRICKDTVEFRQSNNVERNDFMNLLMDLMASGNHDQSITFNELAAQSFIFFIAGFDTSQSTISCAIYELARNPAIQDDLRNEIHEVLAKHNNQLTYEAVQEMKLMKRVICETLRRYPPLPFLNRKCRENYPTTDPKYYIEKGTPVIIPTYGIHHDPELYPEPYRFDPERFSDEQTQNRHPCAWLPFGDGPRNCIGLRFGQMQTAIGIANLVKNFKFSTCERTQSTLEFAKTARLLNIVGGIHLKLNKL